MNGKIPTKAVKTAKVRHCMLTTVELYELDHACELIQRALGPCIYLVGSAHRAESDYRDVDVRAMLQPDEFKAICPTRSLWELLSVAISCYLRQKTGLPIDFQIQRADIANKKYPGAGGRNPLGMNRIFAAGGDATPFDSCPEDDR